MVQNQLGRKQRARAPASRPRTHKSQKTFIKYIWKRSNLYIQRIYRSIVHRIISEKFTFHDTVVGLRQCFDKYGCAKFDKIIVSMYTHCVSGVSVAYRYANFFSKPDTEGPQIVTVTYFLLSTLVDFETILVPTIPKEHTLSIYSMLYAMLDSSFCTTFYFHQK